jgi:lipopolysaccharide export system protein LptC
MNKRLNQAMLVLAIVVVLTWLYMKRTSTKRIEKYEMDKSQIMQHLESGTEIDSILVMTAAAKTDG